MSLPRLLTKLNLLLATNFTLEEIVVTNSLALDFSVCAKMIVLLCRKLGEEGLGEVVRGREGERREDLKRGVSVAEKRAKEASFRDRFSRQVGRVAAEYGLKAKSMQIRNLSADISYDSDTFVLLVTFLINKVEENNKSENGVNNKRESTADTDALSSSFSASSIEASKPEVIKLESSKIELKSISKLSESKSISKLQKDIERPSSRSTLNDRPLSRLVSESTENEDLPTSVSQLQQMLLKERAENKLLKKQVADFTACIDSVTKINDSNWSINEYKRRLSMLQIQNSMYARERITLLSTLESKLPSAALFDASNICSNSLKELKSLNKENRNESAENSLSFAIEILNSTCSKLTQFVTPSSLPISAISPILATAILIKNDELNSDSLETSIEIVDDSICKLIEALHILFESNVFSDRKSIAAAIAHFNNISNILGLPQSVKKGKIIYDYYPGFGNDVNSLLKQALSITKNRELMIILEKAIVQNNISLGKYGMDVREKELSLANKNEQVAINSGKLAPITNSLKNLHNSRFSLSKQAVMLEKVFNDALYEQNDNRKAEKFSNFWAYSNEILPNILAFFVSKEEKLLQDCINKLESFI